MSFTASARMRWSGFVNAPPRRYEIVAGNRTAIDPGVMPAAASAVLTAFALSPSRCCGPHSDDAEADLAKRSGRALIEFRREPKSKGHSSTVPVISRASDVAWHDELNFSERSSGERRASAASLVGSDGIAPTTRTAHAPAAAASFAPRSVNSPLPLSAMDTAIAARNASPAAVASRTSFFGTAIGSCHFTSEALTDTDPRPPNVTRM
eukprot:30497-Pelagococcus_subviridis.AAC.10